MRNLHRQARRHSHTVLFMLRREAHCYVPLDKYILSVLPHCILHPRKPRRKELTPPFWASSKTTNKANSTTSRSDPEVHPPQAIRSPSRGMGSMNLSGVHPHCTPSSLEVQALAFEGNVKHGTLHATSIPKLDLKSKTYCAGEGSALATEDRLGMPRGSRLTHMWPSSRGSSRWGANLGSS